jgi:ABC-type lipoprotein release transport system permease subunit
MRIPFSMLLALGWRNLWRHRRRNGMLLAAILVAVMGATFATALLRGYQRDLADDAVANLTGHVKALADGYLADPSIARSFELAPGWQPELPPREVLGWTARVRVPAVVLSEREARGVTLVGIDPEAEAKLSFLGEARVNGQALTGPDDGRLMLGATLAEQLGTAAGKRIVIMSQGSDGKTREAGFRISATYDAEGTALERTFAFTGVRALQAMLDADGVTEVSVRLTEDRYRSAAAAMLRDELDAEHDGLVVLDWRELEPQAAAMVAFADTGIGIWLAVMLLALAFGLVNTLITAVMERIRELGMLRAIGMRKGAVILQVVTESCLVVLLGVALGIAVGSALVFWVRDGIDLSAWAAGVELAGLRAVLTPRLLLSDVVLITGISLLFGVIASLYPAWQAVRLSPLDALRR